MSLDHLLDDHVETITDADVADRSTESMTARELAIAVGTFDLDALRAHHHGLVVAVAELAQAAGNNWPWGHDDPTVAVLRALAKLSLEAPHAESGHAAAVHRALRSARRPAS